MTQWANTMGFDLTTASGYRWWRAAGGVWPDETPERMRECSEAQAVSKAADRQIAELEATSEEAA